MITYSKLCDKVVEYQHNWGVTNNVNVGEFLKKLGKRGGDRNQINSINKEVVF